MIANIAMAFPGLFHITDFQNMDVREVFQWYLLAVKQLTRHAFNQSLIARQAFSDQDSIEEAVSVITRLAWLNDNDMDKPKEPEHQTKDQYLQRMAMLRMHTSGAGDLVK